MKCWRVDCVDGWCTLMHAETRGKAIQEARRNVVDSGNFMDYAARRIPGLDDLPITYENAKTAGFEYYDDWDSDEPEPADEFINDCNCEICRQGDG